MNRLSHPWSRLAGVLVAAAVMFVLDTSRAGALHQLLLPLTLAAAAYLMTRALLAVAFATFALSAISTDFGSTSWITAYAYPGIAASSLVLCLARGTYRFRQRIISTHDARWKTRRANRNDSGTQV